jgi:hypothetical protein
MGCPDVGSVSANQGAINMKITPEIRKLARLLALLAATLLPALYGLPANAQIAHTWISHNGNDLNACAMASPCATFSKALANTLDGGEVSCLDSGAFGGFVVTISVNIDCTGALAATTSPYSPICINHITINANPGIVTLRGLLIAEPSDFTCQRITGINILGATTVVIEDCVIENFPGKGIIDARTTGLTKLAIKNTIVRNNAGAGIVAAAAPKNSVVLENVQSVGNTYGIAVATGNNVVISRSVMSENGIAGIEADPGAEVYVENTKISHNVSYGVFAQGTVVLANSDITFNTSSISGATTSFGNNRLFGNGSGTAPTPAGGTSTDFAQQ